MEEIEEDKMGKEIVKSGITNAKKERLIIHKKI